MTEPQWSHGLVAVVMGRYLDDPPLLRAANAAMEPRLSSRGDARYHRRRA